MNGRGERGDRAGQGWTGEWPKDLWGIPVFKGRGHRALDRDQESGETNGKIMVTRNNVKLELSEKKSANVFRKNGGNFMFQFVVKNII